MQSGEVRGVRDGELAELLAHLLGLAANDQHRHLLDVFQFAFAVPGGGERNRLSGASKTAGQYDQAGSE